MVEYDIEKKVVDAFKGRMNTKFNLQYIGVLQTPTDINKGEEREDVDGVLAIKVLPRSYRTPTIPDAQIDIQVSLVVRTELDPHGVKYLEMCSSIQKLIDKWQKGFDNYHTTFVSSEFEPTGFQTTGGDFSQDQQNDVWYFNQSFTLYGIVNEDDE